MAHPVSDEEIKLRKRARRRLVGAIVLVAIVVVVLPWFVDNDPPPPLKNVNIVIPNVPPVEEKFPAAAEPSTAPAQTPQTPLPPASTGTGPVPSPSTGAESGSVPPPPAGSAPAAEPPVAADPPAIPRTTVTEERRSSAKPPEAHLDQKNGPETKSKDPAPQKPGPKANTPAKGFVVQLGAFSSRDNAKQLLDRMRAKGLNGYLEPVKTPDGTKTRVRGGPYATQEAAQKARTKLLAEKLGSGDLKIVQHGQ
ncbi:MAG: SPOR domain-containing protein [Betaproteobacteria bacterium]|nr:SPOR domain-containing protein [Betaproteobacteria bacterium]